MNNKPYKYFKNTDTDINNKFMMCYEIENKNLIYWDSSPENENNTFKSPSKEEQDVAVKNFNLFKSFLDKNHTNLKVDDLKPFLIYLAKNNCQEIDHEYRDKKYVYKDDYGAKITKKSGDAIRDSILNKIYQKLMNFDKTDAENNSE